MPKKKLSDLEKLEMKLMEDPAFVEEYQRTKPYADIAMQIIHARYDANLSQKELADKIGTRQSVISRIESFDYDGISIKTLVRIAEALGLELKVQFMKQAS